MKRASEAQCQRQIVDAARLAGWRVFHHRAVEDHNGRWLAALEGHPGFPDLVLVHAIAKQVWFVELKRRPNVLQPDQRAWADELSNAGANWRELLVPEQVEAFIAELNEIGRAHLFTTSQRPKMTVVFHDPGFLA